MIKMLILFQNGWEGPFKTTSVSVCEWFNGFSLHDNLFPFKISLHENLFPIINFMFFSLSISDRFPSINYILCFSLKVLFI